jgi:hypothetical protein
MSNHPAEKLDPQELMQALERFEKELDRAYDAGSHSVTVRFTDAVTVLRAVNILLRVSQEPNQ